MNRVKKAMILAALAFPLMASASVYPWLTFKMTDGTEMSVASEGLAINYNEGKLLLKSITVDQTIPTELVKSMRFTTTPAAVEGIKELISVEADYYDLSGNKVGNFVSSEDAKKALPSGTYILRSKDKTIKIIF